MKIIMWVIIPIAFTLIFFATVDFDNAEVWISLAFVWIAYLIASATCLFNWGKQLSVLNWTMYYCAVLYFAVEIIVAILFLYVYIDSPQWSFATQLLLLVAFILVYGFSYLSNHTTDKQIQDFYVNDSRVLEWRKSIALMQLNNPSVELKELSDLLNITPIMSTPDVSSLDEEISGMIESGVANTVLVINKIKERNIKLKSNLL